MLLRESSGGLGNVGGTPGPHARPAPGHRRRLVCFTVLTRTRRGRAKTAAIRVLTTLLDPDAYPAREIAACHATR